MPPFMMGTTSSTTVQSLGKIAQFAPAVGANVVFVFFVSMSGSPCVRGVHSSNKLCAAVYCPISTQFSDFFQKGLLFQMHYIVCIFVARWRHNVREIAVKIAKIQIIGGKVCAHHFVLRDLKKILLQ